MEKKFDFTQGFVVSGLSSYVEQNRLPLISKVVLGGKTIGMLQKQLGIKTTANLNILSLDPTIASGASCGFSAGNAPTLTERALATGQMKVNLEICPRTLLGKWAEYQVRIGAGRDVLPFEEEIVNELIRGIQKKMETLVWQAKTSTYSGTDQFNGFCVIAANDASADTNTIASGKSAWEAVKETYDGMTAEMLEDGVIFVDPAIYRAFLSDLVAMNLYHYNPNDGVTEEILFPASNVRVINTPGLVNTKQLFASSLRNLYFGTDLMDDMEEVDWWFSKDADVFRIKVAWNAGVQYAFSDLVILNTMAAAPVAVVGVAAGIAALNATQDAVADILDDVHNDAKHSLNSTTVA